VKDENGDLLAGSYNILNRWKNYFSQLLIVHRINEVRQIELHTAEPIIPNPRPSEVENTVANLKRYYHDFERDSRRGFGLDTGFTDQFNTNS
jgi:hypothetical protein